MKSNKIDQINLALKTCNEELFRGGLTSSVDYGVAYLLSKYTSDTDFAYDCVMSVIERLIVRFDSLCGADDFHFNSYFIKACKNQLLSDIRKLRRTEPLIDSHNLQDSNETIYEMLFSRDQKEWLSHCLSKLNDHQFDFIAWLFQNPRAEKLELEGHFSLPVNAVYQKKHRIVKILQKCISLFT
jgi:RNA polymerase sigma factor (sigma-70 family)